jgi:simple sugar transport system permease protein
LKKVNYSAVTPAFFSIISILFALISGAIILLCIGKNPLVYFGLLFARGMGTSLGVVESIIKMAPLLIVSAGLLACFSAGLWNIGMEGQFLIGALLTGWAAPALSVSLPFPIYLTALALLGIAGGMAWVLLPAILKSHYDINEIITTLMMSWVSINLVNWLVKGPINDPKIDPFGLPNADDSLYAHTHRVDHRHRCPPGNALGDQKNHIGLSVSRHVSQ